MAILDRFNGREINDVERHVDNGDNCPQDTIDLFAAVETLTKALETIVDCNDTAGAKSFIAGKAIVEVWGRDDS